MNHPLLLGLSAYFLINAGFMWSAPIAWYDTVPGVAQTGPYNSHFIKDVALAFLVSALALMAAARLDDYRLAIFGAAWPCLHAVFHIWIWIVHRNTAVDAIAVTNLLGIQVPAWTALVAASQLKQEGAQA